MPSCTCIKNPNKYVTNPKKLKNQASLSISNSNEVQSIVTDSEVFDHEALLRKEGSTPYQNNSSSYVSSSPTSSYSDYTNKDEVENEEYDQESNKTDQQEVHEYKHDKLKNTVEKWNELLKEYDENPDVQEVQQALNLVTKLSENKDDQDTKKQVEETIKKLTSSLVELTSTSNDDLTESEKELVLQPCVGDDEETYFRVFVRKLRENTGNAEVELEVNEKVKDNIRVLFNNLGLSKRTLSLEKEDFLTRMSSSIKSSTVFKNLFDPLDVSKSPMDLTTYLHQISQDIENDDLASLSTLSELDFGEKRNPVSNCMLNTSELLDEMVCDRINGNNQIPTFLIEQFEKQNALRNKYGDMSDLPLFIF